MGRPPAAFVGRDEALGVLRTAVRRASGGHPSVLIVTGETGVGKTRLVRELIEQERVTLLAGSCVPMAGDPLPFAPLTQAGTLNLQLERLPELARLVPGIAPAKTTRTADLAAASQLGLFQSVLDLVDRLGAAAPVLHVIEDVHWADRSTLDLVRFLATNRGVYDLVLVDPPYELVESLQVRLSRYLPDVVAEDGLLVFESAARDEPEVPLHKRTTRRYGSARLTLFENE